MSNEVEASFMFKSRGLGLNWLPCFICGHKPTGGFAQADMSAFVDPALVKHLTMPLTQTHPVTDMMWRERFLAKLDFRDYEPNYVQVKLGACGEHEPHLELLHYMTADRGEINTKMLARCLPKRRLP